MNSCSNIKFDLRTVKLNEFLENIDHAEHKNLSLSPFMEHK